MARTRWLDRSYVVLGGRLPAPIALLIGATFGASILAAQFPGVLGAGALYPRLVLQGEVWRLFTWVLFENDPISLIFSALALFWIGGTLVGVWGPGRFLVTYFAIAAASAAVTCLIALVLPAVKGMGYAGPWAIVDALLIAFAVSFPTRDILLYFVLPLRGQNLIYATLAGTLLFALLSGNAAGFIPHFAAELGTLAWLRGSPLGPWMARLKYELAYRSWRRRASKLKAVPPPSKDEAPRWYH